MPTAYSTTAKRIRMYYDPRGQAVRTVNPDATEQWVIFGRPVVPSAVSLNALKTPVPFAEGQNAPPVGGGGGFTPWESFTYDANDLAEETPNGSGVPASHFWTPKSSLLDPLGRTIVTIDRLTQDPMPVSMNPDGTQPPWGTGEGGVVMQYRFDIRGNLLKVTDALDRTAFTHVYDLKPKSGEGKDEKGANILRTTHIDSGTKTALFDAAFKPIELRDAKGALILHGYDGLNRPTRIWAMDNASEDVTLRQKLIYGDDATDGPASPTDTNHLGKLYQHYDEAGLVTLEEYDFKGNVLQKKRAVIADSEIKAVFTGPPTDWAVPTYRVDWEGTPTLEGEFVTDLEYDALNRLKRLVYPEDQDSERKELLPFYNNAGALEKVTMDGVVYVEHIAYNAKGQRLLIAFGNGVMTRYAYDPLTFRLSRMRSERYTRTGWTFEYDSGTNRQDIGFDYDLNGNIVRRRERRTDCGISGTLLGADALDRLFEYDALNRLLRATGRESGTENQNDYLYADAPAPGAPNADNVRAYTRTYAYDRMGNILSLSHSATGNGFSRNFSYGTDVNRLEEIRTGSDDLIEAFTYDANGNQLTAGTTRNYRWDHSDQMRCYYNQTGTSEPTVYAHYLYDAAGNRVKKLVRTSATNWETTVYIDGVFEYQRIETASDTYERNNLHIMDDKSRIAQVRIGSDHDDISDAVTYILDDHLGSSNARLDTSGGVIDREEYFPFGDSSLRTFSHKRYRYVGKEKDAESGLYYYGARYYSAWTCRFISVDPLAGKYKQLTPYQNAANDPVGDYDIDGMQSASTPQDNAGGGTGGSTESKSGKSIRDLVTIDPQLTPVKPSNRDVDTISAEIKSIKQNDILSKEQKNLKIDELKKERAESKEAWNSYKNQQAVVAWLDRAVSELESAKSGVLGEFKAKILELDKPVMLTTVNQVPMDAMKNLSKDHYALTLVKTNGDYNIINGKEGVSYDWDSYVIAFDISRIDSGNGSSHASEQFSRYKSVGGNVFTQYVNRGSIFTHELGHYINDANLLKNGVMPTDSASESKAQEAEYRYYQNNFNR